MSGIEASTVAPISSRVNVTDRLARMAEILPDAVAVACPRKSSRTGTSFCGHSGAIYATTTFAELDADVERIARGLIAWGVPPGTRLALLVRPGIEFVTLVFSLLRAGMVIVLVDPGLGKRHLIRCLAQTEPEGFVAIPAAQAVRIALRRQFPRARWNVTVGRRWFWGGMTLDRLRIADCGLRIGDRNSKSGIRNSKLPNTKADDPAAIIFTSGSTGPPKGVLYTHQMFDTQVAEIRAMYDIKAGGIDLACFPLFALFNAAMGVTTVFPQMDFSRPASACPTKLLDAAHDWQVTQAFASPAVWRNVSEYCEHNGCRIPSLRQVFSCGAPVGADVLRKTLACVAPDAKMHTPYGATECLPVSTIEAAEVLGETAARTDSGAGVCVGRKFDSIEWRVIGITDEAIATVDDSTQLPAREVGELIVRGPQVSPSYVTGTEVNALSKIGVPSTEYSVQSTEPREQSLAAQFSSLLWHRTGDVGYFDDSGRFWYCGRKSQRVETSVGTMYTEIYEAIFNKHPKVRRSALVGIGPRGNQQPVMILECESTMTDEDVDAMKQQTEGGPVAADGEILAVDWPLPVDVRHNAKINREKLAVWAAKQIDCSPQPPAPSP